MHLDGIGQDLGVYDLAVHELDDGEHDDRERERADVARDEAREGGGRVRHDGADVGDEVADARGEADEHGVAHPDDLERDGDGDAHEHGVDELAAHVARKRATQVERERVQVAIRARPHEGAQRAVPVRGEVVRIDEEVDAENDCKDAVRDKVPHGVDAVAHGLPYAAARRPEHAGDGRCGVLELDLGEPERRRGAHDAVVGVGHAAGDVVCELGEVAERDGSHAVGDEGEKDGDHDGEDGDREQHHRHDGEHVARTVRRRERSDARKEGVEALDRGPEQTGREASHDEGVHDREEPRPRAGERGEDLGQVHAHVRHDREHERRRDHVAADGRVPLVVKSKAAHGASVSRCGRFAWPCKHTKGGRDVTHVHTLASKAHGGGRGRAAADRGASAA